MTATAYLVSSGDYSSYSVHRVYLDRDGAEAFCARENVGRHRAELVVEERPLGPGQWPDPNDARFPRHGVAWRAMGAVWAGPRAHQGYLDHVIMMIETYHHPREGAYEDYYAIYDLPPQGRLAAVREKHRRETSTPRVDELTGLIDDAFWANFGSSPDTPYGVDAVSLDRSLEDHPEWGGWISACAISFVDAEHAKKMWFDARAQVLAQKEALV